MHSAIKSYFTKYNLDAVLVTDLINVRYLSGFVGTNGVLLITKNKQFLLTDFRYLTQARSQAKGWKIIDIGNLTKTLSGLLKSNNLKKIGFEALHVNVADFANFKRGLSFVTLIPITEDPSLIRIIKTSAEVKNIAKALAINKKAFNEIRRRIKPGIREFEIALMLEFALRENGAEKLSFDTIVASGQRGALPHGLASDKKLKKGELVTIDFGGVYQGYHADETVTMWVGGTKPSSTVLLPKGEGSRKRRLTRSPLLLGEGQGVRSTLATIHQIVLQAQQAAIKIAGPGVKCSDIDKAARDYIASKGCGKYFGHSLGHGVGLEVHERPILSPNSPDILKPGMVFTIEPGIYIEKFGPPRPTSGRVEAGGVRIEDVFVCTNTGIRRLSQINKSLL